MSIEVVRDGRLQLRGHRLKGCVHLWQAEEISTLKDETNFGVSDELAVRIDHVCSSRVPDLDAAKASRVGVTLSYMGDVVTLDVRDDGVGFEVPDSAAGAGTGFGLTAMRQRVSRVAGTLAVESEPGGGTAISARVPAILAERAGGTA